MKVLINADPTDDPYSEELCSGSDKGEGGGGGGNGGPVYTDCCLHDEYFWPHYNTEHHCCGKDGVKLIGEC